MTLMLKLAQRNIFRNGRRTFLTVLLIACGLGALIFTDSFMKGMVKTMVDISTQTYLSHAQIHKPGYRVSNDVDDYIKNVSELQQGLDKEPLIEDYSLRTISGAMLSSSENISSVLLIGVNAEAEANISLVKEAMIEGEYLSGKGNELIIGYDLADLLGVTLGDRIVVTASAAHGGELSQELLRVSGLFRFNDRTMDKGMAFINLEKSQALLNISGVHEVAIKFQELNHADQKELAVWKTFNNDNWEILNWRDLVPQLNGVLEMSGFGLLVISIIMFSLVALGLINSMFMSIFERHQEFGVLLALGTRPVQIFNQIVGEGMVIGFLSVILGTIIGLIFSTLGMVYGIDYGDLEMSGLTVNKPIYAIIDFISIAELALSIFVITSLSCIYPALHAAKLSPSFAMRKVA